MTKLYYYGWVESCGHDLRGPHGEWYPRRGADDVMPCAIHELDGGEFLPGSYLERGRWRTRHERQSECRLTHRDGWTLLACWDRSGDSRGQSNATFLCSGTFTFDEMVALAREQQKDALRRIEAVKPLYLETT